MGPDPTSTYELLDEIDLGSAKGGKRLRRGGELEMTILRSLTPADLPMLQEATPVDSQPIGLVKIRQTHHHLAQLLAKGDVTNNEASLITGYSPSRISILQQDPLFKELLESYSSNRAAIFVDVMERMKVLGLSTLDELQSRLEEGPENFSRRELMEMAKLMLLDSKPRAEGAPAGQSIALNVKFITPQSAVPMLDVTPRAERADLLDLGTDK